MRFFSRFCFLFLSLLQQHKDKNINPFSLLENLIFDIQTISRKRYFGTKWVVRSELLDEASVSFDVKVTRPSIVLLNLLGVQKDNMSAKLRNIANEFRTKNAKASWKKSRMSMSMSSIQAATPTTTVAWWLTCQMWMPNILWHKPLTEPRTDWQSLLSSSEIPLRLTCQSGSEWATSYYSELLLDTLFENADAAKVKELNAWYIRGTVQEQVCSVSYKSQLTTSSLRTWWGPSMRCQPKLRQTWNL